MCRRVIILLNLMLCWPAIGFGFTADKRDTLQGLTEVAVLIEHLPDDVERQGLSREHLARITEVRLRAAGLRILTISEIAKSPGSPYLYIAVYPVTGPSLNFNSYAIGLALKQLVQLSRNPSTELFATTWESPASYNSLNGPRVADIRSKISDAVERFVIDYRAVNP
jgi:hypothetical protein